MIKIIHVTEQDIRNGVRCNGDGCPIALAIKRTDLRDPLVSSSAVSYGDIANIDARKRVRLPHRARYFISDFDEGRRVYPFRFLLWRDE